MATAYSLACVALAVATMAPLLVIEPARPEGAIRTKGLPLLLPLAPVTKTPVASALPPNVDSAVAFTLPLAPMFRLAPALIEPFRKMP